MPFPAASAATSFGFAIVAILLVTVIAAAIAFARSGAAWRSIGRGPLSIDQEPQPPSATGSEGVDRAAQAAEVRQMLGARAERARERGEEPIDVEAEAARLLSAGAAPVEREDELRDEVRQLVVARNERRAREGLAPLDVEEETDRQLADLAG